MKRSQKRVEIQGRIVKLCRRLGVLGAEVLALELETDRLVETRLARLFERRMAEKGRLEARYDNLKSRIDDLVYRRQDT